MTTHVQRFHTLSPVWLLAVPLATYIASYLYLAVYHGRINLWNNVIHEGGIYTFWETTLYASHFLGHVPIHTVVALLFAGTCRCLLRISSTASWPEKSSIIGISLVVFLFLTTALSLIHFGASDTLDYVLQRKQRDDLFVRGGSWNLGLASTTLLFAWVPIYIYFAGLVFGMPIRTRKCGLGLIATGAIILIVFTEIVNGALLDPIAMAWTAPRYLAHSVREIITFSAIYFPIPLYFIFRCSDFAAVGVASDDRARDGRLLVVFGGLFLFGFLYQSIVPLSAGISEIAQSPSFTEGEGLNVLYLLASHIFEHFLDSVYFSLLTLWLYAKTNQSTRTSGCENDQ